MQRQEDNYYKKLDIADPSMPHSALKTLLKRKWLELHPDKVVARAKQNNPNLTIENLEKIHKRATAGVNEFGNIYKILSDEKERAKYNQQLAMPMQSQPQPQLNAVLALPKPKDIVDYLIDLPIELLSIIFNKLDSKSIRVLSFINKQARDAFGAVIPGLQSYRIRSI